MLQHANGVTSIDVRMKCLVFYYCRSFHHPNQKLAINLGATDLKEPVQALNHHSQYLQKQKDPGNSLIYKKYLKKNKKNIFFDS